MSRGMVYVASGALSFFLFTAAQAADSDDVVITPTAYGAMVAGQINHGYYYRSTLTYPQPIAHVWQQWANCKVGFNALIKNRLTINLIGEGLMAFSTPQIARWPQTMQTRQFFYIKSAYVSYPFGNIESPFLTLQAGYFQYKYNPDARNLGECMLRSNAYPLVIYSQFDYPIADLFGFRANVRLPGLLHKDDLLENDLILHSELLGVPVQDWSLSDIFSYSPLTGVATVSAGVSFSRYFSVYQGIYPTVTTDPYFYPNNLPYAEKQNFYIRDTFPFTDSALFDWKAIKLMGRLSFDPKKYIPLDWFGKEDLKLYMESDLIGLKNYPLFYAQRKDRMLTMIGFNWPTHPLLSFSIIPGIAAYSLYKKEINSPATCMAAWAGIASGIGMYELEKYLKKLFRFDVLTIELEYCHNKSAFSDANLYGAPELDVGNVVPVDSFTTAGNYNLKRSPWRWSLYIKKSLLNNHVSFIAQCARDHTKINFYYFEREYMSFIEPQQTSRDWWWSLKTEFKF
jgi:hypothetical protein